MKEAIFPGFQKLPAFQDILSEKILYIYFKPKATKVLLSLIFYCHKIEDGGYNNTNITSFHLPKIHQPALQANGHER